MAEKITFTNKKLNVPDNPIIPFIEGDGTGPDIWKAAVRVFDSAVEKTYSGKRKIAWKEVFAGEKAFKTSGNWMPEETLDSFREHLVGIKGPLTTPVGEGMRSLNVALRQELDLYVCYRPVRYLKGYPARSGCLNWSICTFSERTRRIFMPESNICSEVLKQES